MMQILIAEDDVNIASDLKSGLQAEGFDVEVVYDGFLAEKLIVRKKFDGIILDINMPGKNGLEVCKAIRVQQIHTPVLMLTAFGEVEDKLLGFECGADDYLAKPFFFKELLARLRALLKRGNLQNKPGRVLAVEDLSIDLAASRVMRGQLPIKLTPREFQILSILAEAKGNTVSKKDLIRRIWKTNVEVNTNTIEVFINSIRNKVDKNHRVKLIHTRPGYGYYLSAQPHET
jgi:DNA-binding response OmpR family regulator